jgi:predicted RNase H-like HicB family nuclease
MSYLVVIERGETSFGAHVPDLPGCVAVGETEEEALRLVREAIALHLEMLAQQGLPIPEPRSRAELIAVDD